MATTSTPARKPFVRTHSARTKNCHAKMWCHIWTQLNIFQYFKGKTWKNSFILIAYRSSVPFFSASMTYLVKIKLWNQIIRSSNTIPFQMNPYPIPSGSWSPEPWWYLCPSCCGAPWGPAWQGWSCIQMDTESEIAYFILLSSKCVTYN